MDTKVDLKGTGRNLVRLRKERGLSVKEISKNLAVSVQTVYHWQNGLSLPSVDNLVMISELFEVPIDDLIVRKKEAGE